MVMRGVHGPHLGAFPTLLQPDLNGLRGFSGFLCLIRLLVCDLRYRIKINIKNSLDNSCMAHESPKQYNMHSIAPITLPV